MHKLVFNVTLFDSTFCENVGNFGKKFREISRNLHIWEIREIRGFSGIFGGFSIKNDVQKVWNIGCKLGWYPRGNLTQFRGFFGENLSRISGNFVKFREISEIFLRKTPIAFFFSFFWKNTNPRLSSEFYKTLKKSVVFSCFENVEKHEISRICRNLQKSAFFGNFRDFPRSKKTLLLIKNRLYFGIWPSKN